MVSSLLSENGLLLENCTKTTTVTLTTPSNPKPSNNPEATDREIATDRGVLHLLALCCLLVHDYIVVTDLEHRSRIEINTCVSLHVAW